MQNEHLDALIFSCKAAVSAVVADLAFGLFHLGGVIWAPISAVIVTQPTMHPSIRASFMRVGANMIGAFIGALMTTVVGFSLLAMAIGIVLTGLVCHFAKLDEALRPAYAAVVIVTLSSEVHKWFGSLDRVLGVTVGCVSALAVGFVFSVISNCWSGGRKSGTAAKTES